MKKKSLDTIDHIALQVENIANAIAWYKQHFNCDVLYQDESWAIAQFGNIKLAFILPEQHPPHIAIPKKNAEDYGTLSIHRDKLQSVYIEDQDGNSIEILKEEKDDLAKSYE